jgi:hypothetical protein
MLIFAGIKLFVIMAANVSTSSFQTVSSIEALLATPFEGTVNAVCLSRDLSGDFSEIIAKTPLEGQLTIVDPAALRKLDLSEQGQIAREIVLNDFEALTAYGAAPTINVITSYERDDSFPFFPTDVYSFHVDRSPIPSATFLCTYYGDSSEILPNEYAEQKIHIPEIRNELKKIYDGLDEEFDTFLSDYFFDLHYRPKNQAPLIRLGQGNLWKLAIDHPQSPVLPCIHRAPLESSGTPRLLLIC